MSRARALAMCCFCAAGLGTALWSRGGGKAAATALRGVCSVRSASRSRSELLVGAYSAFFCRLLCCLVCYSRWLVVLVIDWIEGQTGI